MKWSRTSTTALVAVVAVGAAVGLWWKPWQSTALTLPKSGCWGVLGPNDVRPVVGPDGTVTTASVGSVVPSGWRAPHIGPGVNACSIIWNGKTVARADLGAEPGVNAGSADNVTLAPGIVMIGESDSVEIYFRCDGISSSSPYGVLWASSANGGVDGTGLVSEAARNGYANIALKLAKVAAAEIPCTNHLDFPSSVPTLKPYPKV